ncbi:MULTISPECIES: TetR/AcrR family transcriptional regulator [Cryobacterium]|uniref:TetR/AcrR family transcriptional regulator n=1 Tax=Cryobacterium TaxID=69578 RepID=UPI000CD47B39|nr:MULTISPECIES: TetR/AcrR family transcriptional regulator [Cryobacterium]POH64522.1 TetR family transcriptional regulator [Cryobacterium zongtaii]TFC47432.1 TetR/AcrR family transcriptional regulator [Cryobacterium sp. TMN-39-2]
MNTKATLRRPTTKKGQATRDRIVAAAATLMHDRGVAGTNLDDVEGLARVGRSQLYYYFRAKDDLVDAVIEYRSQAVSSPPAEAGTLSTWEFWAAWRDNQIEHSAEHDCAGGCPLGSLASELADISEDARLLLAAGFTQWEDTFREGLDTMKSTGLLREDADPARLARVIITSLEGGLLMSQTHRDKSFLEVALDGALGYVRHFAR